MVSFHGSCRDIQTWRHNADRLWKLLWGSMLLDLELAGSYQCMDHGLLKIMSNAPISSLSYGKTLVIHCTCCLGISKVYIKVV